MAERCRELRCGRKDSIDSAARAYANRSVRFRRDPYRNTMTITLVHEGGFRIEKDFQDRWAFLRPDGIAVPACGYRSKDMMDEDLSEMIEMPPAGGLLSRMENNVSEPPPPAYLH